jgi:hypothetical protein
MYLLHESTFKFTDGSHEVSVFITGDDGKRRGPYTYLLPSVLEVKTFETLCGKGLYPAALAYLNRYRDRLIRK